MRRETELMRRILNSPHAQRIIDFVAPIYGESETALWLFESIGQVLDGVSENIDLLRQQVVPGMADWSLPYWEAEYNITPESSWNIEQRRDNIIAKIKYVAPVNPAKLEQFTSAAMGVPCEIIENISKNTFRIVINGWSESFQRLKVTVNAAKPAHLIWNVHANIPPIIIEEQPGKMMFQNLRFKTFVNDWNCYVFNGTRCFDESILFNQKSGGLNFIRTYIGTRAKLQHPFSLPAFQIQKVRIVNPECIPLYFHVKTFVNYGGCIFNGRRRFDGSILMNQKHGGLSLVKTHVKTSAYMPHRLYQEKLKISPISLLTREKFLLTIDCGRTVFDNMGDFIRLNGDKKLDDLWNVWQRIKIAVLQNLYMRVIVREESSVYKTKIQKFNFTSYSFRNYNKMSDVSLTIIESSRLNGKESFDGTLLFNGKAVPKTEII